MRREIEAEQIIHTNKNYGMLFYVLNRLFNYNTVHRL